MFNYFKVLSFVWGTIAIGVRALIHIIPEHWASFELNTVYSQQKPRWIGVMAAIALGIVALTWYMELTTEIDYSLILTILVTLTVVKVGQLVFNYQRFRAFVHQALVEERRLIVKINIGTTILGVMLMAMESLSINVVIKTSRSVLSCF